MEKRKDAISALKICRFCLTQDDSLSSLYDRKDKSSNIVPKALKILSCIAVEVFPSDKMPSFICERCNFFMDMFYDYKQICRKADERILQYIQNGMTLEALNWPASLSNMFKNSTKNQQVVKTVVGSGATVEVMSQDISNSEEEEDEENVYNIKIGDGSNTGAKCIKIVTSKNEMESKDASKSPNKDDNTMFGDAKSSKHCEEGSWACDECDCSYPLQQLMELHKKQKHRIRTVQCQQCDAKFFSKADLMTHSLRHSDDTPFECVACDRKFKRLALLKRHEKILHSDIEQQACPLCPATFLSLEELEAHQHRRHPRRSEKLHICNLCDKRFAEKSTLQKHMEVIHFRKPKFRCEYCPMQFTSVSKLARHVRTHASGRPYPCKYCEKTFTKSHHYTRHLRLKHRDASQLAVCRSAGGYRCEQCGESFGTQDSLLYHSAIHATQNLTCPLCQERFEDVDAVTAHIKSHVNGIEFMCDMCELVFTSRSKLDHHMNFMHADEISQEVDESSTELEGEDDEDDNGINVKEEDGEMVVEINKSGFLLSEAQIESDGKPENTNSEDSEPEPTYTELSNVDTVAIVRKESPAPATVVAAVPKTTTVKMSPAVDNQTANILRKAEEVKRKAQQTPAEPANAEKKVKTVQMESGASEKSLRLLEKELQELKRTNTRNESSKTPAKPSETLRNRRPQLFSSTPKLKTPEEKKIVSNKTLTAEKKVLERSRVLTKENKEPKESKLEKEREKEIKEKELKEKEREAKEKEKETKEKEAKDKEKDTKEKETKEKEVKEKDKDAKEKEIKEKEVKEPKETEIPKHVIKNGTSDKSHTDDTVRRSTRPSKIKDYAKMIRDKSQVSSDDDSDDADDEEYKEIEKPEVIQNRSRGRRASVKSKSPVVTPVATPTCRKRGRGRPRKEQPKEVPAKMKKEEESTETDVSEKMDIEESINKTQDVDTKNKTKDDDSVATTKQTKTETASSRESQVASKNMDMDIDVNTSPSADQNATGGNLLVSPSGQALKKVPMKALPPGIKRLPLPLAANARAMGAGELCEMQIGKKVVKVQKIVMTKAEVEAMAKKGLVEMKDGTMVLKQGIKLPSCDSLKSRVDLSGDKDAVKESL